MRFKHLGIIFLVGIFLFMFIFKAVIGSEELKALSNMWWTSLDNGKD